MFVLAVQNFGDHAQLQFDVVFHDEGSLQQDAQSTVKQLLSASRQG